jgi:hypothetical protein
LESGSGRKVSLAADSAIAYKFSFNIKPRLLASSAGNTPGRILDVPGLA